VQRADRVLFGLTLFVLAVVAVLLALVGGFYSPAKPHVLGVPVPIGVLIAIVGNLVVGIGGAWGTGSRVVPAVTGLVWLVVAFVLGTSRPEGDVVVSGSGWLGISYLFLGAIAAAVAIGIGPNGLQRRRSKPSLDP
jgi:hypothetical protein